MFRKTWIIFCLLLLCASRAHAEAVKLEAPAACRTDEAVELKIATDANLPASSFFRINLECPVKPAGGKVDVLAGYPVTTAKFSKSGIYECEIETGIVGKNSCAGASYRKLDLQKFKIKVLE